jgi:predicted RNA-binding Zn ribbon-like protein
VNFNSHMDAVVAMAVRLVNALTAGEARGHDYAPPAGPDLARVATAALRTVSPNTDDLPQREAIQLAEFAQAFRAVFTQVASGDLDTAAHVLNRLLAVTGAHPWLDSHDGEPWHLHFHGAQDSVVIGWAAGCATGLAVVLGSDLRGRLGVCTAPHCDQVYVDTSRNGTRRFCSTSCQNRVKTAAFRARHA